MKIKKLRNIFVVSSGSIILASAALSMTSCFGDKKSVNGVVLDETSMFKITDDLSIKAVINEQFDKKIIGSELSLVQDGLTQSTVVLRAEDFYVEVSGLPEGLRYVDGNISGKCLNADSGHYTITLTPKLTGQYAGITCQPRSFGWTISQYSTNPENTHQLRVLPPNVSTFVVGEEHSTGALAVQDKETELPVKTNLLFNLVEPSEILVSGVSFDELTGAMNISEDAGVFEMDVKISVTCSAADYAYAEPASVSYKLVNSYSRNLSDLSVVTDIGDVWTKSVNNVPNEGEVALAFGKANCDANGNSLLPGDLDYTVTNITPYEADLVPSGLYNEGTIHLTYFAKKMVQDYAKHVDGLNKYKNDSEYVAYALNVSKDFFDSRFPVDTLLENALDAEIQTDINTQVKTAILSMFGVTDEAAEEGKTPVPAWAMNWFKNSFGVNLNTVLSEVHGAVSWFLKDLDDFGTFIANLPSKADLTEAIETQTVDPIDTAQKLFERNKTVIQAKRNEYKSVESTSELNLFNTILDFLTSKRDENFTPDQLCTIYDGGFTSLKREMTTKGLIKMFVKFFQDYMAFKCKEPLNLFTTSTFQISQYVPQLAKLPALMQTGVDGLIRQGLGATIEYLQANPDLMADINNGYNSDEFTFLDNWLTNNKDENIRTFWATTKAGLLDKTSTTSLQELFQLIQLAIAGLSLAWNAVPEFFQTSIYNVYIATSAVNSYRNDAFGDLSNGTKPAAVKNHRFTYANEVWKNIRIGDILIENLGTSEHPVGHAAMFAGWRKSELYGNQNVAVFIEAQSNGVYYGILDDKDLANEKGEVYSVVGLSESMRNRVVNFAKKQYAKEYNMPLVLFYGQYKSASSWFCSELVYSAYNSIGLDINDFTFVRATPGCTPFNILNWCRDNTTFVGGTKSVY